MYKQFLNNIKFSSVYHMIWLPLHQEQTNIFQYNVITLLYNLHSFVIYLLLVIQTNLIRKHVVMPFHIVKAFVKLEPINLFYLTNVHQNMECDLSTYFYQKIYTVHVSHTKQQQNILNAHCQKAILTISRFKQGMYKHILQNT